MYTPSCEDFNNSPENMRIVKRIAELIKLENIPEIYIYNELDSLGAHFQAHNGEPAYVLINPYRIATKGRRSFNYAWAKNIFWVVVAHELQHERQHESGRIEFIHSTWNYYYYKWDGKNVKALKNDNELAPWSYYRLPWELDANYTAYDVVNQLIDEGLIKIDDEYYQTESPQVYFSHFWLPKLYARHVYELVKRFPRRVWNFGIEKISRKAEEKYTVSISEL